MEETNVLDILYYARLEKISKMNKEDIVMLGDISLRISEYENNLEECFSKLENEDIKKEIRDLVAERIEIENEISSHIKEKFYKTRISRCKTTIKIAQKSVLFFLKILWLFFISYDKINLDESKERKHYEKQVFKPKYRYN